MARVVLVKSGLLSLSLPSLSLAATADDDDAADGVVFGADALAGPDAALSAA